MIQVKARRFDMNSSRGRRRMRERLASGHIFMQWKLLVKSRVVSTDANLEGSFKKSPMTDTKEERVIIRYEQEERARRVSPQLRNFVQLERRSPLIASSPGNDDDYDNHDSTKNVSFRR